MNVSILYSQIFTVIHNDEYHVHCLTPSPFISPEKSQCVVPSRPGFCLSFERRRTRFREYSRCLPLIFPQRCLDKDFYKGPLLRRNTKVTVVNKKRSPQMKKGRSFERKRSGSGRGKRHESNTVTPFFVYVSEGLCSYEAVTSGRTGVKTKTDLVGCSYTTVSLRRD